MSPETCRINYVKQNYHSLSLVTVFNTDELMDISIIQTLYTLLRKVVYIFFPILGPFILGKVKLKVGTKVVWSLIPNPLRYYPQYLL